MQMIMPHHTHANFRAMSCHNSNFDVIFAYLTCTNYDFRCTPRLFPTNRA